MPNKRKLRGGRDTKVRIALDICKLAQRRGDLETQKRALETVCELYNVDPTQLTDQGLGDYAKMMAEIKRMTYDPAKMTSGDSTLAAKVTRVTDQSFSLGAEVDKVLSDIDHYLEDS